uniref:CASP-like protein n=1 Tax=Davidia involucrata TaxID=16924 RepID=A0A5B7C5F8_DAVIN
MASTEPEKTAPPPEKVTPPPESKAPGYVRRPTKYLVLADVILRVLLFASTLTSVVVMVTSKQTEFFRLFGVRSPPAQLAAKFNHSPAFIYFVAALSVACLYSIISSLLSLFALLKPGCSTKVLVHLVIIDVLLLGIVAAATGSAGAIGYLELKGNSHVGWQKVCKVYDKFCQHIGSAIFISLFASILLVLLVLLSVYSLSRKIPK